MAVRRDIQGLRMLAVVAVILNHVLGRPSGGFVGVDVFFVISGFVITGSLMRDGSLAHFYRRRVKRILPLALTVIVATVVAALFLFNTVRFEQTVGDSVWSVFSAANWHFAAIDTDYFQSTGPVSPLQHYWSLAVEEQFYLVWPLLLLMFARSRRRVTAVVTVLSLAWALFESVMNPMWAYFSTFSRSWERRGFGDIGGSAPGEVAVVRRSWLRCTRLFT